MAHNYTITTPKSSLDLDNDGRATAAFTVTNISGAADRGMAKVVPQGSTEAEWVTIAGNGDREFTANGVNQFDVKVAVPPGTPPGAYSFRFDMASARRRTAEEYDEGPTVKFDVAGAEEKPARWWIWVAAAVVLLVVGAVIWLAIRPKLVPVPDVNQKPFVEAIRVLQSAGFKVALKGQRNDQATAGTVLDHEPKKEAKKNSVIALTVATHTAEDLTLSDAESTKLSDSEAARLQKAMEGEQIAQISVPPVMGMDGNAAMVRIFQAGLVPELMPIVVPRDRPAGVVIQQRPAGGASVAAKSTVTLAITQWPGRIWNPRADVRELSPALRGAADRFREKSAALPTGTQ